MDRDKVEFEAVTGDVLVEDDDEEVVVIVPVLG